MNAQGIIRRIGGRVPALCVGVLVGTLGVSVVVNAQGGSAGEVRACVLPPTSDPAAPNVRLLGAGETCDRGTPLNWNVQGPAGPAAEVSSEDVAPVLGPPPGTVAKTTAKDVSKYVKTGKPSVFKSKTYGPGPAGWKAGDVECPSSFPRAVVGGYLVKGIDNWHVTSNYKIELSNWSKGRDRWFVAVQHAPLDPGEPESLKFWSLKVSVKCTKK
jgi:hypothetical protein